MLEITVPVQTIEVDTVAKWSARTVTKHQTVLVPNSLQSLKARAMTEKPPIDKSDDPFDFDLDEVTFPIKIAKRDYLLVEADSEINSRWHNALLTGAGREEGGRMSLGSNIGEAGILLVAGCMFEIVDEQRKRVSLEFVRRLPARVFGPIHDKVMEISGLNSVKDDKAKNS